MAVSDYSATAASNTTLGGIDLSGTTGKVMDGDNVMRAMAADMKAGLITGYTTTATAAGTTTLTVASNSYQYFTGATTQTIVMPVTSTLELGRTWVIVNNSTGALTVNSSGGNLITTVSAGGSASVQCILLTGTDAASWKVLPGTGLFGDGTVALPSVSFVNDPNTGIYRIGADNIGVAANGAKVLDIATTGLAVTGTLSSTGVLTASSTIELGHASDTTLSRAAAGVAAIEGRPIVTVVREQVFTGSGTYTPHANMVYCIIQVVGSGGGAGGCTGAANQGYGGGGGGGGGCARKIASAATIGASQTVTIGAVGTGGTASANGTAGSDCSVGALAVGKGGAGGLYGAAAQRGLGGAGGVAGTGDVNIPGQSGGDGDYINSVTVTNFNVFSGYGGSSLFGYGAKGVTLNTAGALGGTAGQNYGTGGSGATSVNTTSTANGGNGSTGIVVITEFCSA